MSKCLTCETPVFEYVIYCKTCYEELCLERKELVKDYIDKGHSFSHACKLVADIYDIDESDVSFLFVD